MKTDSEIQLTAIEELNYSPQFFNEKVGVAVKKGVVTLYGKMNSYHKKIVAANIVKKLRGIKRVSEEIEIQLSDKFKIEDEKIRDSLMNLLEWNSAIKDIKLELEIEAGVVTLYGNVNWKYQNDIIQNIVQYHLGVVRINNYIKITSKNY